MKVSFEIVNAFIDGNTGGNTAGVVLDANSLSSEQKLKIAQKVGLSETAFVSQSQVATRELEYFTPEQQIARVEPLSLRGNSLASLVGPTAQTLCLTTDADTPQTNRRNRL